MHSNTIKSLQKLLDKYPQYKDEKALYNALQDLIDKERAEDEMFEYKAENIGSVVVNSIPFFFEENDNKQALKSGYSELDKTFGGFSKGEYIIIGGRPSMGKSQFLVNIAMNLLDSDCGVAYFSFDLNKTHLLARMLACKSGIAANKILQNKLSAVEKTKVETVAVEISTKNLHICDATIYKIETLEAECHRLVNEHQVSVVFIDYLQLIDNKIYSGNYYNRDREIGRISRIFKKISIELNIAVICSSQLSRSVETRGGEKKPYLSDLRDSGNIEQDADKVLFIYRPEYYGLTEGCNGESLKNIVEIIVAKNRNGYTGSFNIERTPEFTGFKNFINYIEEETIEIPKDRLRDFDIF